MNRFLCLKPKAPFNFKSLHSHNFSSIQQTKAISNQTPKPLKYPSFAAILRQINGLKHLQQVHGHIIASGLTHNIFLSNRLVNSYACYGLITVAEQVFRQIHCKNVVSWTTILSGFTKNGLYMEAFEVFCEMKMEGITPNEVTVASILPVFAELGLIRFGKLLQCSSIRAGLDMDNVYVGTALVVWYAKCGRMDYARSMFDKMTVRNIVSWNAIISGYANNWLGEEALSLFSSMQEYGFVADFATIISILMACSSVGCLRIGSMVHSCIVQSGFETDGVVGTALMDMYVKCGSIKEAYRVFNDMEAKDLVSWTLMLSSFSEVGYGNKAIELFNEMMAADEGGLDSVALAGVLSSCSRLGALQQGRRIHGLTMKTGFEDYTFVGTALIDMYSNCGSLESSRIYFDRMSKKDVICWNAMIAGYGMNGRGTDAIVLFLQMKSSEFKPDECTLVCVLSACSHAALVDEGISIFYSMVEELGVMPNLQHYTCVIDLLGRAGRLDDASFLINKMPMQPDANVYGALLGACRIHKNIKLGLEISGKLFELDPKDAGYYVLLSNMYAVAGNWEGVKMTRVSLRSRGLKKVPGFSLIEIDLKIHAFLAGNIDHPQYPEIDEMLKGLIEKIEAAGYVPDTKFVFQDLSDDIKRETLYHHSEKLAIAFGLLRTQAGSTVRITKNLRICNDCHTASKFISKAVGREIVIKDSNRFHFFKDGVCSCRDYW